MDATLQFDQFVGQGRWPPKGLASTYCENPGVTQLAMGAMTEVNSEARARLFCDAGKIEVYKDRAGLERQEALPAVQKTMGLFEELAAAPPELTTFTVSSSEP